MQITQNSVVSITYALRLNNAEGELVQEVGTDNPLVFLFGAGNLLPAFEDNLDGKQTGDAYAFTLQAEEAYGPVMQEAIVDIPQDVFVIDGKLAEDLITPGNMVNMRDQDGNPLQGKVISRGFSLEQGTPTVKVDFNHPMAGQVLHFTGTVVEVRPATESELAHGHVHGPGGHHH
jgi:FKBP-type peptidyl-prolyl cis-trans isomerase SlyD